MNNESKKPLSGAELDLAVANALKAEQMPFKHTHRGAEIRGEFCYLMPIDKDDDVPLRYKPSTDWSIGGPIIERERVTVAPLYRVSDGWIAWSDDHGKSRGATALEAAMRAVVKKCGDAQ